MDSAGDVFRLFANCMPVKGARRSTICDLQYHRFDFIPNGLYYILTELKGKTVSEIKAVFDASQHVIIDEYFTFLQEKEYGFFCAEPELFPDLDLTWMAPEQITNAIIDVNEQSRHPYESIFDQLDALGCKALQLRFFDPVSVGEIEKILDSTQRGGLRHIELLLPYSTEFSDDTLKGLCVGNPRISGVVVSSAPKSRRMEVQGTGVPIDFTSAPCTSPACCGETSPKYFVINIGLFTEAQEWNTCLNRKISVSVDGTIRNCPSMPDSFGNVGTISLSDALMAPQSKDLWNIKKDQIKVCRDCEFRYICTDCRAYREDPSDLRSKPLKCGYNPYSAEWKKSGEATAEAFEVGPPADVY
jgi:SPASM domain peptide maturase of grasp-with-spasm system